jgi:hypothetical protein
MTEEEKEWLQIVGWTRLIGLWFKGEYGMNIAHKCQDIHIQTKKPTPSTTFVLGRAWPHEYYLKDREIHKTEDITKRVFCRRCGVKPTKKEEMIIRLLML